MTCNGAAFAVGDHVVIQFHGVPGSGGQGGKGPLWTQPKVIGFVDNPKPCQTVFITDPSSTANAAGARSVLSYTVSAGWFAANEQTGLEYGNVDWVNTAGDIRLSWWGLPSRYFFHLIDFDNFSNFSTIAKHGAIFKDEDAIQLWTKYYRIDGANSAESEHLFSPSVYKGGRFIGNAPDRVFGLGVAVDPSDSDNVWIIVITGDDPPDSGHSVPGSKIYAAAWNGNSITSVTWILLDSYSYTGVTSHPLREEEHNITPWFGNGSGTEYKSIKYDGAGTAGNYIFTASISFPTPSGAPTGAITKGPLAWSGFPEVHAIDYIGDGEWRLEDTGTVFNITDGTTTYELFDNIERDRPNNGDPGLFVMALDLRAGAALIQKDLFDEFGVPNGFSILIRIPALSYEHTLVTSITP
jgi:hypothetical protein